MVVFQHKSFNHEMLWSSFFRLVKDLDRYRQPLEEEANSFLIPQEFFGWHLPMRGWIKINVDAIVPLDKSAIAIEVIAYDHEGRWLGFGYSEGCLTRGYWGRDGSGFL